jgi:inosine/xanthosine triphosphatase
MKILAGSENPVKVEAVREAFSQYFADITVVGMRVESGVSNQPFNNVTFEGARNRAFALRSMNSEQKLGAEFFVGLEGGVAERYSRWFVFGAVCIMDLAGHVAYGTSPHFEIPERLVARLDSRQELGDVIDEMMGERNTKQREGAIGFFTRGVMTRKDFYVCGLLSALVPFLNKELFNQ